jgi:hypothetical protein
MSNRPKGNRLLMVYRLLVIPAFALAIFSVFVLDAPWTAEGWGVVVAWLVILNCWAMAISLLVATTYVQRWRFPLLALPGFTIALLLLLEF